MWRTIHTQVQYMHSESHFPVILLIYAILWVPQGICVAKVNQYYGSSLILSFFDCFSPI